MSTPEQGRDFTNINPPRTGSEDARKLEHNALEPTAGTDAETLAARRALDVEVLEAKVQGALDRIWSRDSENGLDATAALSGLVALVERLREGINTRDAVITEQGLALARHRQALEAIAEDSAAIFTRTGQERGDALERIYGIARAALAASAPGTEEPEHADSASAEGQREGPKPGEPGSVFSADPIPDVDVERAAELARERGWDERLASEDAREMINDVKKLAAIILSRFPTQEGAQPSPGTDADEHGFVTEARNALPLLLDVAEAALDVVFGWDGMVDSELHDEEVALKQALARLANQLGASDG